MSGAIETRCQQGFHHGVEHFIGVEYAGDLAHVPPEYGFR